MTRHRPAPTPAPERTPEQQELLAIQLTLEELAPFVRTAFSSLAPHVYKMNALNGFWEGDRDNFGAKIALVHSELSEALEAHRKDIHSDDKLPMFTGVEAELADAIIRILDMAGRWDLNLGPALTEKLTFNAAREFRHGKLY